MKKEINIRLNANRAKAVHTGYKFASGDKGVVFKIVVEELDTTSTTAKIVFKRSNGTSVEADITSEGGIYSYTTLGNEFAVVGSVVADVKFYAEEKRISTCTFVFEVTSDTLDGLGKGTGGYSDTLEKTKASMEQALSDMNAAKSELEKCADDILLQMKELSEKADTDVEETEAKMNELSAQLQTLYAEYEDAFGGVGPLNPRGEYSATVNYKVRDMVSYGNETWVCYRNCTGVTPGIGSAYWQRLSVGDAKTLGGHGAEYFVDRGEALNTSILEKALTVTEGVHHFRLGRGNYIGGDLPDTKYAYGMATVFRSSANGITVVLYCGWYKMPLAVTQHNGTSWLGWDTVFTNSGGEIDGSVRITSEEAVQRYLRLKNAVRRIDLIVNAGGSVQLRDETNGKNIIDSQLDGTNTFNGMATDAQYVKINNSNELNIKGLTGKRLMHFNYRNGDTNQADDVLIDQYNFGDKSGGTANSMILDLTEGSGQRKILHTGNRPTGTYTGNGDATSRTVAIGGIGETLRIFNSSYGMAFIGKYGGVGIGEDGITIITSGEGKFENGVLTMASTSNFLNANTYVYEYDSL